MITAIAILLFPAFLILHSFCRKPSKSAVISMLSGVVSLVLAAPLFSGTVNLYTVFLSLTLGIPGTAVGLLIF